MKNKFKHMFGHIRFGNCYLANLVLACKGRLAGLTILFERDTYFLPAFAGITHKGNYIRFVNKYEIHESPITPLAFIGQHKIFNYRKFASQLRLNPYIKFEYVKDFSCFIIEWKLGGKEHYLSLEWKLNE